MCLIKIRRENKNLKKWLEWMLKEDNRHQEIIIEQSKKINKAINYIEKIKCCAPDEEALDKIIKILEGQNDNKCKRGRKPANAGNK